MLRAGLGAPAARDEAAVERLYPRLLELYAAALAVETRLYDGAEAALDRLAAEGWRLAVCTNKPEGLARLLLDALGIGGRFAALLGADSLPWRKPDPRHLTETIAARRRRAGAGGAGRRHGERPRGGARGGDPLRAGRLRARGRRGRGADARGGGGELRRAAAGARAAGAGLTEPGGVAGRAGRSL